MSLCYSFILLRTVRRPFLLQKKEPPGIYSEQKIHEVLQITPRKESKPAQKNNDEADSSMKQGEHRDCESS